MIYVIIVIVWANGSITAQVEPNGMLFCQTFAQKMVTDYRGEIKVAKCIRTREIK